MAYCIGVVLAGELELGRYSQCVGEVHGVNYNGEMSGDFKKGIRLSMVKTRRA